MSEDLTKYLQEINIKVQYIHSNVLSLERTEILRDLRLGIYDVIVGVNLLREGLDLPEVSLVAILDADKEGFLRSETSLIQTIGRAARHSEGKVLLYADQITGSMERAIDETNRRRKIQLAYNKKHQVTAQTVEKEIRESVRSNEVVAEKKASYGKAQSDANKIHLEDIPLLITSLEKEMRSLSKALEFEKAAQLRDKIIKLRKQLGAAEEDFY